MAERYLRHFMDQQILFLINRDWARPWLDRVMAAASSFDLWVPFLIVLVVILAIRGGWRVRAMLLAMGLAVGITDGLVVGTLKKVVGRPRPHEAVAGVRTLDLAKAHPRFLAIASPLKTNISGEPAAPKRGNSFPSGHAGNTFAVATVGAIFYRRWGWLLYLPAMLVAYSRIYVGSHWPLDVLVSCLIGAVIGWGTALAFNAAWGRWGARLLPDVHRRYPSFLPV